MAKTTSKKRSTAKPKRAVAAKAKSTKTTAKKVAPKKRVVAAAPVVDKAPAMAAKSDTYYGRLLFALLCLGIVLIGAYFVFKSEEIQDTYYKADNSIGDPAIKAAPSTQAEVPVESEQ